MKQILADLSTGFTDLKVGDIADATPMRMVTSDTAEKTGDAFVYDGKLYGVIEKHGILWLDRNLGADRVAQSLDDADSYGDLYQWGRLRDGHEKRDSGTTDVLSETDDPGHDDFITTSEAPIDWRTPQNNNLWQGVDGTNNPCPPGWRLPTISELETEAESWDSSNISGAFGSSLKFPAGGQRWNSNGNILGQSSDIRLMTSSFGGTQNIRLLVNSSGARSANAYRAGGGEIRPVRDIPE